MCPSDTPSCCPRQTIKAIRAQTGVALAVAWKAMHDESILHYYKIQANIRLLRISGGEATASYPRHVL